MASCALALCLPCASPWKIKISCCCCIGRHSQHPHAWRSFFSLHFTIIFLGRSNLIIIVVIIAQLCMNDSFSLALAGSTLRATQSIIHTELQLDWKTEINTNFPISHVIISNLMSVLSFLLPRARWVSGQSSTRLGGRMHNECAFQPHYVRVRLVELKNMAG